MNKYDIVRACKWIFGSLAIAFAVYVTKESSCLWLIILLMLDDA